MAQHGFMKPDLAIIEERKIDAFTILTIDTKQAAYQNNRWFNMGDFGKRKFENWLVMMRPKERLKFIYQ